MVLTLAAALVAQSTDASLSGSVLDPAGAVIGGAKVTITNKTTGGSRVVIANDAGTFIAAGLPPGTYRVTAEQPGFKTWVLDSLTLDVGAQQSISIVLQVGQTAETIEVQGSVTDVQAVSSSIGNVITGKKLEELPLVGRSAYDLIATTAGVSGNNNQNFNGARGGALNITLDGANIQDSMFDGVAATAAISVVNVDRIAEFRIVTSPADAELGRGSGQIIMVSRAGGNQFHGSVFWEHRNTLFTANTWHNNFNRVPRNFLLRNQYGARTGGPVRRNQTFFNAYFEGQRQRQHNLFNAVTYRETARQGIFRYWPGVQNANALAANPTVDFAGNPIQPRGATGALQAVNVMTLDPLRNRLDQTGTVARLMGLMPLPNNFLVGDGLNTGGYQWQRVIAQDYDLWGFRMDHNFTVNHRLNFSFNSQENDNVNTVGAQPFPGVAPGRAPIQTHTYAAGFTSVLRSNLINEFRAGVLRPRTAVVAPWETDASVLGSVNNNQFILGIYFGGVTQPFSETNYGAEPARRIAPIYQFGDTMTWLRGKHSIRAGFDYRNISNAGFDTFAAMQRADVFTAAAWPANVAFFNLPGIGVNAGASAQLASELSGAVGATWMTLNSPGGRNPTFVPGLSRYRRWSQNEFSWFVKDDWKITPSFTLNVGIRYEWFDAPFETEGLGVDWKGGGNRLFGLSGNGFGDLFRPGQLNGALSEFLPIGPKTDNPGRKLWANDNNNFGPAIGFSWSLPWWGKDKTVVRAGYQLSYGRNAIFLVNSQIFGASGYAQSRYVNTATPTYLSDIRPIPQVAPPLGTIPITDRSVPAYGFDPNLYTPYYQNWNFSIDRALGKDWLLSARYVRNKGNGLPRSININETNIFENGILDAYNVTLAGGNAPLFDAIFRGFTLAGRVVDGVNLTGSEFVRQSTATRGFLANNSPAGLANFLNINPSQCGFNGCLLSRAGLPPNFITANPQFTSAFYVSNFGNSSYDALQIEVSKRFSGGYTFQGNYTFSKALGDAEGDEVAYRGGSRTLRNRQLDRRILTFHRTHVARLNGIWELPIGPGRMFGRNTKGILGQALGGWQIGGLSTLQTGQPFSVTVSGAVQSFNLVTTDGVNAPESGAFTPVSVAAVSPGLGQVSRTGNGVVYFANLRQVTDPSIARMPAVIQPLSALRAIVDQSGNIIMQNPAPGQLGSMAPNMFTGPNLLRLDLNLIKRFRIGEQKDLIIRADALNLTNTPFFGLPVTDINSPLFGRINSTLAGTNRVISFQARFTF
jgi:hypothetical protein